ELGHFEDRQGRLVEAERYYQQATVCAPQETGALNDLALCLARQGKLEPSAEILHRAIRIEPTKALYRNNMATVLMELGEQQDAMLHLMAAHPPATAFYNMGHLLEKGGKLPAAAAHYAEATRLDPSMRAAQAAFARINPAAQPVPQTAMATQPAPVASPTPQGARPSQPSFTPAVSEPSFGPKLLPPTE
ncbi:MAG: tetratricopeptide repeat protein, partial [Aeoliella sp.]